MLGLWLQAEVVAMATDLAEVVGGAIALNLLFGLPLFTGGLITGAVAFLLLALQTRGDRRFIGAVTVFFGVILVSFLLLVLRVPIDPGGAAAGLVPRFDGVESLVLATGILGATVMPHAIYLHSALASSTVQATTVRQRRRALKAQRMDVLAAMGLAGLVNASMLLVAAALFAGSTLSGTDTLEGAHAGLRHRAGRIGRAAVRAGPAGVGLRVGERGHLRRPGDHGGLPAAADPAVRPPRAHPLPGPGHPRAGRGAHRGAGRSRRSCCRSASRSRWSRCCC